MRSPFRGFRRAFLTGLVVIIPVVVTFWVIWIIVRTADGWLGPSIARTPWLHGHLPQIGGTALGLIAAILLISAVGAMANSLFGRAVLGAFDRLVTRIPFLKGIYTATKELTSVLFSAQSRAFRKVVLFEYPRRGSWSLGFVTNELPDSQGGGLYHLFLPTTPNPTSGYFLLIPYEDAIQLDISIEEGLKMVISGGAVVSPRGRELVLEGITSHPRRAGGASDV